MAENSLGAWGFYQGWDVYQELLIKTIAPLTAEQLTLRSAPHLRSVGENCRHIIGARARWFHQLMGIGDQPFAALGQWDRAGAPEHNTAELVGGLRDSWQVMHATLTQWTPADLAFAYPNDEREPGEPESFTRQWVVWHLIEHDVFHGGEISQIVGMHGLTGLDL